MGAVLCLMWHARLAAGVLALQLVAGSGDNAGAAQVCDVANWEAVVDDHLPLLQASGLQADSSAVAAALARHAAALQPIISLPATVPGSSWCTLSTDPAGDDGAAHGVPVTPAVTLPAFGGSVAAPDAVLAICVSRTSSSLVCSPAASTNISRTASTALAAAATPAAVAPGGRPTAAAAVGDQKTGAVILSAQQQQQQGQQILGLSWELARQDGDKLRAVASCVGPQYNCTVLQQHMTQQQQQQPISPRQGLSHAAGATVGRARPLVFASRNAGIISSHLCAPAALMTHLAAAAAVAGGSQAPRQRQPSTAGSTQPQHRTSSPADSSQKPSPTAGGVGGVSSGSSLSGFMSQMLDQLRWPPDPWVVGEFPNRRSHSFGSAGMGHVAAAALAAHPSRPLYVSGSSTGRIYLWQFGEVMCKAAYVPITSSQVRGRCAGICWQVRLTNKA